MTLLKHFSLMFFHTFTFILFIHAFHLLEHKLDILNPTLLPFAAAVVMGHMIMIFYHMIKFIDEFAAGYVEKWGDQYPPY